MQKTVYHHLNLFTFDGIGRFFVAECWVPVVHLDDVRAALQRGAVSINEGFAPRGSKICRIVTGNVRINRTSSAEYPWNSRRTAHVQQNKQIHSSFSRNCGLLRNCQLSRVEPWLVGPNYAKSFWKKKWVGNIVKESGSVLLLCDWCIRCFTASCRSVSIRPLFAFEFINT